MQEFGRVITGLTAVMVTASVALIGAGLVGLGATLPLAILLGGVTGLLYAARSRLGEVRHAVGVDIGALLRVIWIGGLLAAILVVATGGASPGELQAIGGLCGLVGMANYFLRPVYGFLYLVARRLDPGRSRSGRR